MAWIRMGVFVALTLVATTLPAIGLPAPAPDRARNGATGGLPASVPANASTHSPTPHQSRQAPDDTGLLLQAASQMDVWRSAPTRPLGHSSQIMAAIGQATPAVWKPSPSTGQDLQSNVARAHEHSREWLMARYPNAPPALG